VSTRFAIPSIRPFLLLQSVQIAVEAKAVVTGNHTTTLWTFPFCLLSFEKGRDALVSDVVQILYLAHSELRPIPLVDRRQSFTRKGRALVAVLDLVLSEQVACLLQERTWLVPGPASDAVHHPNALALHVVCDCQICSAHVAVHAAGRDKLLLHVPP